jgi:hypothetical protein
MSTGVYELGWRADEARVDLPDFMGSQLNAANVDLRRMDPSLVIGPVEALLAREVTFQRQPNTDAPTAQSSLITQPGEAAYSHLGGMRIAAIGAGAASTLWASYMVERGFNPGNITFFEPSGRFGGQWNKDGTIDFNNPEPLVFSPGHTLSLDDRRGIRMRSFLRGIAGAYLGSSRMIADAATGITRDNLGNWIVSGDDSEKVEADYVVVGTGAPHPRRISGNRLLSNLDMLGSIDPKDLIVEREQRRLSVEELESGRTIVLVGLGNSTGTMLRQIQAYEDKNFASVPHVVISDLPLEAVENPRRSFDGHKSIFRDPRRNYFTGYSADIFEHKLAYERALYDGKIVSDARAVLFDPQTKQLVIVAKDSHLSIETPHVFALLGFERDNTLFEKLGAMTLGDSPCSERDPNIRFSDGAVATSDEGYASNIFAAGAVMATSKNSSVAVIPGMFPVLSRAALTVAVRSHNRLSQAQPTGDESGRIRLLGQLSVG